MGAEGEVVRNDALSAAQALSSGAKGFLISPGPCTPNEAGISLDLVAACREEGLLTAAAGENVVRMLPPLIVSDAEVSEAMQKLDRACQKIEAVLVAHTT